MRIKRNIARLRLVVHQERAFFALIENRISEWGFEILNTCPLERKMNILPRQRNSEFSPVFSTKPMPSEGNEGERNGSAR